MRRWRMSFVVSGTPGSTSAITASSNETFFLYVRSRMSGFGSAWNRPTRPDVERYPLYRETLAPEAANTVMVSARDAIPTVIGPIQYLDRAAIKHECSDFRATFDRLGQPFVEPFLTASSPGIVAAALRNDFYTYETDSVHGLDTARRVEYETIVAHGFLLQLDCPGLAMERHFSYQGRSLGDFLGLVDRVVGTINAALVDILRDKVRLHVCWGNYEGRTIATSSCRR